MLTHILLMNSESIFKVVAKYILLAFLFCRFSLKLLETLRKKKVGLIQCKILYCHFYVNPKQYNVDEILYYFWRKHTGLFTEHVH